MIDYDTCIKDFIYEWENHDIKADRLIIRKAMSCYMTPFLYEEIRKQIKDEDVSSTSTDSSMKRSLSESILHSLWYFFWSFKWFLFLFMIKDSRFLMTSLMSGRETSLSYLNVLLEYSKKNNVKIIHFSVFKDIIPLFSPNFYCFPHFLYKPKVSNRNEVMSEYFDLMRSLKELAYKHFKIKIDLAGKMKYYFLNYHQIINTFKKLISLLSDRGKIVSLFQDSDYVSERIIFAEICNSLSIKTIFIPHAITFHNHLIRNTYSQILLAWGEQQKERILTISKNKPSKVYIIGHPIKRFDHHEKKNCDHNWIYILPSFDKPHIQSIHRSKKRTYDFIENIIILIEKFYPKTRLLIKKHPSDDISDYISRKVKMVDRKLDYLINRVELIFAEDSTMSIEILKYRRPIIYVTDEKFEDYPNYKKFETDVCILRNIRDLQSSVHKALETGIRRKNRMKMFEYYFGSGNLFHKRLLNILMAETD